MNNFGAALGVGNQDVLLSLIVCKNSVVGI
jgi:hypothetical protein